MTEVFARNLETEAYDGNKLIVRRLESELSRKLREVREERLAAEKKIMPVWLSILALLFAAAGLFGVAVYCELVSETFTFAQTVDTGWIWLLIAGIACILVGGAGLLLIKMRSACMQASSAYTELQSRAARVTEECFSALGVPEDAARTDAFVFRYRLKPNGKRRGGYFNEEMRFYREGDALYASDGASVFRLPAATAVQTVKKRIAFYGWNKKTQYNKGSYRGYKIRLNDGGAFVLKRCILIQAFYEGEEYVYSVPPYELDEIVRLTGRAAETNV